MSAILESNGLVEMVNHIYHDASDGILMLLNFLFIFGAIGGYLVASSERNYSNLYVYYDKFWKSCAISLVLGGFYVATYNMCQKSPDMIRTVLIINYLHAVVTILRLVYCIYKVNKAYKERTK